jgi:hypothetical protein
VAVGLLIVIVVLRSPAAARRETGTQPTSEELTAEAA